MRRLWLLLPVLMVATVARAQVLRIAKDTENLEVRCDNLVEQFQRYVDLTRENEVAVSGFVIQMGGEISGWYDNLLAPLEGRQVDVAAGQFAVVQKGAEQVYTTLDAMYENSDYLDQRREAILERLPECLRRDSQKDLGERQP